MADQTITGFPIKNQTAPLLTIAGQPIERLRYRIADGRVGGDPGLDSLQNKHRLRSEDFEFPDLLAVAYDI